MKVRTDFVSNSSSSSTIIVDHAKRTIKKLAADLARCCIDKKDQWHDPALFDHNRLVLEYCMSFYRLAYFGNVVVGSRRRELSAKKFVDEFGFDEESAKIEMERIIKDLQEFKKNPKKFSGWKYKQLQNREYIAKENLVVENEDISVPSPVVSQYEMEMIYRRHHYKNSDGTCADDNPEEKKLRVNQILNDAIKSVQDDVSDWHENPDIYQITLDTVKNTEDLLKAKVKIDFDDTPYSKKSIKEIKKLLLEGKKIFYIRQAYDGDGYGETYIYAEGSAEGLPKDKNIEQIANDLL